MKKPHPPGRKRGQSNTSKRRNSNKVLSPRLARLLTALLKKPRTVRQLIDEIPTNNPAEYASILRRRFGLTIPCEHKRFITIDGRRSWYGIYRLTVKDKQKAKRLIGAG